MKKILLLIFVLLFMPKDILAFCSYSELANLKSISSNINYYYDYEMVDNKPIFKITINNIYKDFILEDNTNNKKYYPNKKDNMTTFAIDGFKDGGSYKFTIYTDLLYCEDKIVYIFYVNIPHYNPFYNDSLCLENYVPNYCSKWSNTGLTYDKFVKEMTKEKEKKELILKRQSEKDNKWLNFYLEYYKFILPTIIIMGIGIIYSINKSDEII